MHPCINNHATITNSIETNNIETYKKRYLRHLALSVTQVLTLVHCQGTSTATETVTLRSEFATIALFAEQITSVLGGIC